MQTDVILSHTSRKKYGILIPSFRSAKKGGPVSRAFSLTVCRNLSLDKIRKAGNGDTPISEEEAGEPDSGRDPYERMMQRDRVEQVRRIVDSLPEKQKSCMQLRDFEGKSYKEIAKVLGITEEQVKVNIFRARQAVKLKFNEIDKYGL